MAEEVKMIYELMYCAIEQGYESEWGTKKFPAIDLETWLRLKEIEREVQNGF